MAKKTFLQFIKEKIQNEPRRKNDRFLSSTSIGMNPSELMHVLLYDMNRDMSSLEERRTGQGIYEYVCWRSTFRENRIVMGKLARQYMSQCLSRKIRFERIKLDWE